MIPSNAAIRRRSALVNSGNSVYWLGLLLVLLIAIGLLGCSDNAVPPSPPASPTAPVVIPDGGQLLSGYSLENAPYGFTVPADLKPTIKIDQKNLVTLGLSPADGMLTHDYLMRHLNTMGFSVDGSSADSLIFHDAHWQGALTVTVETAALTLRLVK